MSEVTAGKTDVETMNLTAAIWRNRLGKALWYLGVAFVYLICFLMLMPLYWMITGAFKSQHNAISYPPEMFPTQPTMKNWHNLLVDMPTLRWLLNSFIVAGGVAFFGVITSTLAGYAFGKKKFPGSTVLFWLLLITMMLPKQISLIPVVHHHEGPEVVRYLPGDDRAIHRLSIRCFPGEAVHARDSQ